MFPSGVTFEDIINPIKPDKPRTKGNVPAKKNTSNHKGKSAVMPNPEDAGPADGWNKKVKDADS